MHIEKYNKHESTKVIAHNTRKHKHYSNEKIDQEKSILNTTFVDRGIDYLNSRSDEVYIYGKNGKKKDEINYTCSVVVQYPKNCPVSEEEFFKALHEELNNKFGEVNCISSVVHRDEDTENGRPHLHYTFMPIIELDYFESQKKGYTAKLCAKEVVNRDMLLSFHQDMEKALSNRLNADICLTTKEPRQYVKDLDEYKQLEEERKQLQQEKELFKQQQAKANTTFQTILDNIEMFLKKFNLPFYLMNDTRLEFEEMKKLNHERLEQISQEHTNTNNTFNHDDR